MYPVGMEIVPIFPDPAHLVCGTGPFHAWFTEPPGVVVQLMAAAPVTLGMARWLIGPGLDALHTRFPVPTEIHLVLDVRPMTQRDPAVRTLLMEHAREHIHRFAAVVIIPPTHINAVYLTTLQAAVALLNAFGSHVTVETSLPQIIQRFQLTAATSV
jgi:hypothetical protein